MIIRFEDSQLISVLAIIPEVQRDGTDTFATTFQQHTPSSVVVIHVAAFILNSTSIVVVEDRIVFLIPDF